MRVRNPKDLVGGLLMGAIGALFLAGTLELRLGTAQRMGPGYFPMVISLILIVLGVLIVFRSVQVTTDPLEIAWRPLVWVSASLVAFGLSFAWLGLVPAIILTVITAAAADRSSRPLSAILLGVGFAIGAWLIFRVGLNLPMPPFRGLPWNL